MMKEMLLERSMATTRKTITLTTLQDQWVKVRIAAGDYTNDSEYFRDLIRRDQEQSARFRALKQAIQEGLDSGLSELSIDDIWREVEKRTAGEREEGSPVPERPL
jgi:antitoxin ParD1/3/4